MIIPEPIRWSAQSGADLDDWLEQAPTGTGAYLITTAEGEPYLGRTSQLRRRLKRLLAPREGSSRMLHLRTLAQTADYWPTASWLENALISYELARKHFPDNYAKVLRLPHPSYVKLITTNRFPRTQVTTRLGRSSRYWGPFATRAAADDFEKAALDLFQVRRCQEDLAPSSEHPGCIYGEMRMCLRPCQAAVTDAEYSSEVTRLEEFLTTGGESSAEAIRRSRDRLSEEMEFEQAARQHTRLEKIQAAQKFAGELSADPRRLNGIAITRTGTDHQIRLWFILDGLWRGPRDISLALGADGKPISLDARLKESSASAIAELRPPEKDRPEHLAILWRWFFRGSRDGEWLPFADPSNIPWRKLVNAVHRVSEPAD